MILLILFLFILLLLNLIIQGLDIVSPTIVTITMYLFSSIFALINHQNWYVDISIFTLFIIIISLIVFAFGELTARQILHDRAPCILHSPLKMIKISKLLFITIVVVAIGLLVSTFFAMRKVAYLAGYQQEEGQLMMQYARYGSLNLGFSSGYILAILTFLLRSFSYIFTFIYFYNKILTNIKFLDRSNAYYLFPSLVYLIQSMLFGNRGTLIEYVSYTIILSAIFLIKREKYMKMIFRKVLKRSLYTLIIFFLVFYLVGLFKGAGGSGFLNTISTYTGSSIIALDQFISTEYLNTGKSFSTLFGEESFIGFYSLLYRFGLIKNDFNRILEFISIGPNAYTNIYTALRRYINDFGIMGMLILQFFIGFGFGLIYAIIKKNRSFNFLVILYSQFFMVIVYQSIDEQLLTTFLSATMIFTIIFSYIIYILLVKKKINIEAEYVSGKRVIRYVE